MTRWNPSRFQLERFTELGMAIRHHRSAVGERTLLWIHGLGESGLEFEEMICDPRLADHHHLVPDLLGYGKSTWPEQPLGLSQHAASLDLLLDRLSIEQAVVVGHSMGGVIGLYLADRRRRRCQGLFNIEGNISPADCTGSRKASEYDSAAWLERGWDTQLDGLHREAEDDDPGTERADVLRAYCASIRMADPRTFHRNSLDLVRESDAESLAIRLAELELPQVYVHGHPRGTGERSLELLHASGIPTHAIAPAGHWPHLDQPDATVDALLAFLDSLPSATGSNDRKSFP